jgi:hypothetical protein
MVPPIQQPGLNLDRLAAQHAQELINDTRTIDASKIDNAVTKALGVLQERGFYACFLFLFAKDPDGADTVVRELLNLLQGLGFGWQRPTQINDRTVLAYVTDHVTVNLERMMLAKETAEQMLIYARYGAKARSG